MLKLNDYGAFAPMVAAAGSIIAMGSAIALGFKGRARWEPIEEDVPRGPQKVGGLVSAVAIALIWAQMNEMRYAGTLTRIAVGCLIGLVISALAYGLLQMLIYEAVRKKPTAPNDSMETERMKVIGGLWLKKNAKSKLLEKSVNVQRLFEESEYTKDDLWDRLSQGLAKMFFTIGYLGLTVAGTVALGSTAILIALKMQE